MNDKAVASNFGRRGAFFPRPDIFQLDLRRSLSRRLERPHFHPRCAHNRFSRLCGRDIPMVRQANDSFIERMGDLPLVSRGCVGFEFNGKTLAKRDRHRRHDLRCGGRQERQSQKHHNEPGQHRHFCILSQFTNGSQTCETAWGLAIMPMWPIIGSTHVALGSARARGLEDCGGTMRSLPGITT